MKISTKGQYALRAVLDLAINSHGKPVSLGEIAKRQGISLQYLEQLFHQLKKRKIVKSIRGPQGGYLLSRDKREIRVSDVIRGVREKLSPTSCSQDKPNCKRIKSCRVKNVWRGLERVVNRYLDSITLEDLSNEKNLF